MEKRHRVKLIHDYHRTLQSNVTMSLNLVQRGRLLSAPTLRQPPCLRTRRLPSPRIHLLALVRSSPHRSLTFIISVIVGAGARHPMLSIPSAGELQESRAPVELPPYASAVAAADAAAASALLHTDWHLRTHLQRCHISIVRERFFQTSSHCCIRSLRSKYLRSTSVRATRR